FGKRPRPALLLLAVIGDQMKERAFFEIAKPTALWIGPAQIAAEQMKSEILKDFIGSILIGQGLAQIAANCTAVPFEQFLPGSVSRIGRAVMRQADERPRRRQPAEPEVLGVHGRTCHPGYCNG